MLIPVRCFTCNKEISSYYDSYVNLLKEGYTEAESLNKLEITRICCRRMLLCHVDISEKLMRLNGAEDINMDL
ncbi:DNA-directed RNA polymerase, subunit RPB10 [Pseudoloma neurophilia]|uniref:DNA-directed RNA polymerases I, II, and III subunit RPABC5 n=1 Tax=Pseudoloma neurophilia TaxID=146866 RepID=A0A0R0M1N4_9MICR|nr:DNA-directed RNA polymerase, subunit RPB10 [Pseudoloma neurophilia]